MISKFLGTLVVPLFLFYGCNAPEKTETAPVETPAVATEAPAEVAPAVTAPPKSDQLFGLEPLTNPTAEDLARGQRVYKSNCVRCHNPDPNLKGNLGPQQVDAPFEVVVSKIMTGKYPDQLPEGFVPKRKTRAMTPLKQLKNDIPYIHAWIQSVRK